MKKSLLAKAIAIALVFSTPVSSHAGIPVTDGGNIAQNAISAMQNVAAVLKQIEQYRTQLKQYETQLKNSLAPAAYVWDQAIDILPLLQQGEDVKLLSSFVLTACQQENQQTDNNQKRREELRKTDILKQPYKRKE